ncbi:MAG: metal-dependent hydrolase [Gammaproteobacteria bacterium]
MADFKTHMLGAALVSGVAATAVNIVGAASNQQTADYFMLGVMGGLLPDIDSDTSIPVQIASKVLSVIAAFVVVFHFSQRWSLVELIGIGLLTFVFVRYAVFGIFTHFTAHRGVFHTIPAGLIFGLLTTLISRRIFDQPPIHTWFCGIFVALGFYVHLLLDELYSVNLMGAQLKKSFGTAFRLWCRDNLIGSAALYLAVILLFYLSPPTDGIRQVLFSGTTYQQLHQRFWPHGGWFGGLF